ncbi:hypothetical protein P7D22_04670 [Lichenihabitans sp. Uapishka_5]|uniref:hypothetical protein n=1 Tax=Lichenihabitans sp. Uapishka_5 TaxID=3037302 RepID=UPI0029E7D123|nr:hypothetical protein [Lichenihabitans sp. Uapishka_5]MDX7950472.1 hypothetical protein [Lichenihabitans sp. Uapishka_5]
MKTKSGKPKSTRAPPAPTVVLKPTNQAPCQRRPFAVDLGEAAQSIGIGPTPETRAHEAEGQPRGIDFRPLLVSIPRAAQSIGIGTTKMKELVRDGRITATKLDGRTLIRWDALQAFVEALPSIAVAQ